MSSYRCKLMASSSFYLGHQVPLLRQTSMNWSVIVEMILSKLIETTKPYISLSNYLDDNQLEPNSNLIQICTYSKRVGVAQILNPSNFEWDDITHNLSVNHSCKTHISVFVTQVLSVYLHSTVSCYTVYVCVHSTPTRIIQC